MNANETRPLLVVVTGPPASGKSGLAEDLAAALGLPLLTKDGIKETLFDTLGTGDEAWSKRLGEATWRVLFHVLEATLRAGSSLVVEGNFEPDYADRRFAELPEFIGLQVHCDAPVDELLERFRGRNETGDRHPGHREGAPAERELEQSLVERRWRPLDLPGAALIEYSPHDDPAEVVERIRAAAAG